MPKREKTEVLAAFAAHKDEVTAGYVEVPKRDKRIKPLQLVRVTVRR